MHILLLFSLALATSFAHTPACDQALATVEFTAPGLHLYPANVTLTAGVLEHEQVARLTQRWRFDGGGHAEPLAVARVPDPDVFSHPGVPGAHHLPVKFPGTAYGVPGEYAQFRAILQRIIDVEHRVNPHADDSYAYLSVEQIDVAAGATAGPPGFRAFDGDLPVHDGMVDHSYFVADELPQTSSHQRFRFSNFDFETFDVNSEFDRQAMPEFEVAGEAYVAYLAHGFTPNRAAVARSAVRRTALRLTFSRRRFDLGAATVNPLFPYARDAGPRPTPVRKKKYLPAANLGLLDAITSLDSLSGPRLGLITVGGDGGRGAAMFAKLLRRAGRTVKFVVSVRPREDVFDFAGPESFPERVFDREVKVTAMFSEPEAVAETLFRDVMAQKANEVDQLIVVDVGGQSLTPYWGQDRRIALHRMMTSLAKVDNPDHPSALVIVGPGYGLPADSPLAHLPRAKRYVIGDADRAYLLGVSARWAKRLAPRDPSLNVWLQALARDFGPQTFAPLNPHDPAIEILPEHQDLILTPVEDTLVELSQIVRGI